MKIRTDFVTNSSSSSFILGKPFDKEWTKERTFNWFKEAAIELCNAFRGMERDIRGLDEVYYNKLVKALRISKHIWIDTNIWSELNALDKYSEDTYNVYAELYKNENLKAILDKQAKNIKIIQCSGHDLYNVYSNTIAFNKIYKMSKMRTLEELESIIRMKIVDMVSDINNIDVDDWYFQEIYDWYDFREHFDFDDIRTIGKILIYQGEEGCVPHILAEQLIEMGEYGCIHMG